MVEAWLAKPLREWLASDWQGKLTLSFPGSRGIVAFVQEARLSEVRSNAAVALWGDVRYGSVKVSFQGGHRHLIEEVRTTMRSPARVGVSVRGEEHHE